MSDYFYNLSKYSI